MNNKKITNAVLATKIDGIYHIINEVKPQIRANTEFRLKAKGFISGMAMIGGLIGGGVVWILTKLFTNK